MFKDFFEEESQLFDSMFDLDNYGKSHIVQDKVKQFMHASRKRFTEHLRGEIEKKYGKKGKFTGTLGYQGMIQGIGAYEQESDRLRDYILNLLSVTE